MNNLRNSVRLIGTIPTNPEIITLSSGKKLVKFTVVTTEQYEDEDGSKVDETYWHNCVDKRNTFTAPRKGWRVLVDGKLTNKHYIDKQGDKQQACEVVVNEILLLNR